MKRLLILILLTSAALAVHAQNAEILSLSGTVEIREPGSDWTAAQTGQVVSTRSMISTGFGSRARLSVGGMELSLQPLTRVVIDSLSADGPTTRTQVSLRTGRVRASRPPVSRSTQRTIDFRVSTPVATAAVRGTDFEQSFNKLVTDEGLVALEQGQAVVLLPGGTFTWAVDGLRPIDPLDLIEEKWGVSPVAGSIGSDQPGGTSSYRRRGSARIILQ